MHGKDKDYVRQNVLARYYPDWLTKSYAAIKPGYRFDETCQQTVPAAIISFLESSDYADCLKLAIALGGDSDTLAAIAGPMAYAYYKEMPQVLIDNAKRKLPQWMLYLSSQFDTFVEERNTDSGTTVPN
jgi:ADP-ribosylglycohydrolase